MKRFSDILSGINILHSQGDLNITINTIQFDSRKVAKGDVFVAVAGSQVNGHDFIESCIEKGAKAIVYSQDISVNNPDIVFVKVENSAQALGIMASNYYGNPTEKLQLVGVTGTNGKTSTATILHKLFIKLGYRVGLISTIENKINEEIIPATHTTPDPVQLNALLRKMVDEACTHCFMEVSSHALDQNRVAGLKFTGAIFTNITHDHLDYHKTFDEYIKAKKKFFDNLDKNAFALTNLDDKRGAVMLQNCKAKINTYSLKKATDFRAKILSNSFDGLELDIDGFHVWFKLIGEFNVYNLLAIYATAVLLGEEKEEVLSQLSTLDSASGRFDYFINNNKITAIVDYAHTPDALENVLKTISTIRTGNEKLITVVGCGGNRDKEKRPVMAQIAAKYSNKTILTSDNPRNEEPEVIINEMRAGLSPVQAKHTLSITDRKEAIRTACMMAEKTDIILVAGKGHENYQEVKGIKYPFDDKEILKEILL